MELRPSNAAVWSRCSGYASLVAAVGGNYEEETDNEVREDGTAAHWVAEATWGGRELPATISPNGREVTDEMLAGVDEYHTLLKSWPVLPDDIRLELEQPVSQVFPGVSDGTPDAWTYDSVDCTLYLADLKFGYRPVEVWRNPQLIVYAWTLVWLLLNIGHRVNRIRMFICQPRCPHRDGTTREWSCDPVELGELAAVLQAAAEACWSANPVTTAGPWCRSCAAAHSCRTLQAAALGALEVSYDATPMELTEPQLGYELTKLLQAQKHIENRINGLNTQAEALIRRGKRVPGFELSRAATRWRWRPGAEPLLRQLAKFLHVEVEAEPKLKSVAKLRGLLPEQIVTMYAEKPTGELRLAPVDPNEAIKRFTQR